MKIIFFGDSLTQGTVDISYVDKVAAALPKHAYLNKGINGDTSLNLYRRVQTDVIDLKPDAVFIMIGVNDALSTIEPAARIYYRFLKRIPGGQIARVSFRENMRAIYAKLIYANIKVWVALPPIEQRPEAVSIQQEINAVNAELCQSMKIPVLDLMTPMTPDLVPERPPATLGTYVANLGIVLGNHHYEQRKKQGGYNYSFDGVHLSESGAQQMASLITAFLGQQGVE